MTSSNDITGDKLISKQNTKEFEENYDRIFKKDKVEDKPTDADKACECFHWGACCGSSPVTD